jgi:ubiquinone/menaquinone biosynthesis C-methylase UbiE
MPSPSLTALAAAVLHVPGAPERVLEVGCGAGDGALFLARE